MASLPIAVLIIGRKQHISPAGGFHSLLTPPRPCANTRAVWQQRHSLHQLVRGGSTVAGGALLSRYLLSRPLMLSLWDDLRCSWLCLGGSRGAGGDGLSWESESSGGGVWCEEKGVGAPMWGWERLCSTPSHPAQVQPHQLNCSLETPPYQEQRHHL